MYKYVIREYCIHTPAIPRGESVRAVLLADVHGKADRDGCRKLLEDIQYRVRKQDAESGKPTADLEINKDA